MLIFYQNKKNENSKRALLERKINNNRRFEEHFSAYLNKTIEVILCSILYSMLYFSNMNEYV